MSGCCVCQSWLLSNPRYVIISKLFRVDVHVFLLVYNLLIRLIEVKSMADRTISMRQKLREGLEKAGIKPETHIDISQSKCMCIHFYRF